MAEYSDRRNSLKESKRIKTAIYAVVVIVIILIVGLLIHRHNKPSSQNQTAQDKVSIVPSGFAYPKDWQEQAKITSADKSAGVISQAVRTNPDAQVIIRVVQQPLAQNFDINKSLNDTANSLSGNLQDFTLINKSVINLGKNSAISLTYRYSNTAFMYQQTQIIVPTKNKTYYLTITEKVSDVDQMTDTPQIQDALSQYVASHS